MHRSLLAGPAALVLAVAAPGGGLAQAPTAAAVIAASAKPLGGEERRRTVEDLAKALVASFVFPDVGARYAAMLRAHQAAGAYDRLSDPAAFGEAVTADLQAVAKDGHLRLAPKEAFAGPRRPKPGAAASTIARGPPGLEEASLKGDVAYLRFNAFPEDGKTAEQARRFLLQHADAKAVIIDARPHRGGGLEEMNAMLPLLYARPTTLVRMDTRASADAIEHEAEDPHLIRRPSSSEVVSRDHRVAPDRSETRLQHVPVYYLTSTRTASAAEHLALAFKRTHRATLVGETTAGAGHYGGVEPIGERFAAFIPVGRTYDPDTGWDWEGKGVAPDVAVPADQALDEALKRARAAGAHPT